MADNYIFTRDFLDNNRINLQHYLWTELFGYHIHPSIPTDIPHLRVADVGTGTGIWLTDLARRLPPTVALDGLDISFDALPLQECLPGNMALYQWNVLADEQVPRHLRGKYDIVHMRLFCYVIADEQIEPVMRRLVQLLKPNGHIQVSELDITSARVETARADDRSTASTELYDLALRQDARLKPTWMPELPSILTKVGLADVQCDSKDAPPYMAIAMNECNLVVWGAIARKTGNKAWAEEIERLMPEVEREVKNGVRVAFTRWEVVGRRADFSSISQE